MNRDERRRNGIRPAPKAKPAKPQTFGLVPAGTHQSVDANGNITEIALFHVVTADGQQAVTHTPAGPVPITIASLPVIVGRETIARGPLIH